MNSFKKFIALILAGVLVFALAACGESSTSETTAAESLADSEVVTDTPYFDPITYLASNGFYKNVTATDIVTLMDYKSIVVPADVYTLSDEYYQAEVETILEDNATETQVTDRAVVDGDTLNIDYIGYINDVAFDNGSTDGAGATVTIGTTQYIDDFLEQLIGHKPGETINVDVTFPTDYSDEELAGCDARFVTTINYIVETTTPEFTDEFVAENYGSSNGWYTMQEFHDGIADIYKTSQIQTYVTEQIQNNSTYGDIPEVCTEYCKAYYKFQVQYLCSQYNLSVDEYCENYGYESFDELYEAYQDTVLSSIHMDLAFQAVAEEIGYEPTDEDIQNYFVQNYGESGWESAYQNYTGIMSQEAIKHYFLVPLVIDQLVELGYVTLES